ncbi:MAG: 16S rRNA (cytosine(1402)-N(4))-methyltransferase RsmH [Spirochaetes bacterium]|nr:16S rRNA (cytosine(1402)-N(4))-methyltransferase RsmH [Spirochaetota bacterium]MBU1079960.1 16S rRNA (cytosine(1402)-N(4))-methyltransferase RsmH [Spirochaetota bacterium]
MSDQKPTFGHVPVMLRETLEYLVPPTPDCLMIDGTLGLAGHSSAFLSRHPGLRLVGVDADAEVQAIARARLEPYGERVRFVNSYFDEFFVDYAKEAEEGAAERPALVLFDFGVSMFHFRESGRGFSLQGDEALDMRLGSDAPRTAAELVNELDERELYRIISEYGEEPFAYKVAQAIVRERKAARIDSTARLADIVRGAVPSKVRYGRIHPATRTFQALRIAVNDELGRIGRAVDAAIACLADGGLLGCISFHSLEDRIVKLAFRAKAVKRERAYFKDDRESPIPVGEAERCLVVLTKKPVEPADDEVAANPASRSAKLRVAKAVAGTRP